MLAMELHGETQGAEHCCLLSLLEATCSILLPGSLFEVPQAERSLPLLRWEMAVTPLTTELHCYRIGKGIRPFGRGVTYVLGTILETILEVNLSCFVHLCCSWLVLLSQPHRQS